MSDFGDENQSRHLFWAKNILFWRRESISSPFLGEKHPILATKPILVTIFQWKTHYFDDEPRSRHRFEVKKALFWRRASFSSPFWGENHPILTTRPVLVTIFRWKRLYFGDESQSRRYFEVKNVRFWRRESISSPFLGEKHPILATKPILVTIFQWKTHYFDDEPRSRHRFAVKNARFWRRAPFSSLF